MADQMATKANKLVDETCIGFMATVLVGKQWAPSWDHSHKCMIKLTIIKTIYLRDQNIPAQHTLER